MRALCCFVLPAILALSCAASAEEAARVVLQNDRLTMILGKAEKGAILSLTDAATSTEFAAPRKEPRLFALAFSEKAAPEKDRFTLSSLDATGFTARTDKNADRTTATFTYDGLGGRAIRVSCTAVADKSDPLLRWRISAAFPADLVLEEVQFPFVMLRAPLGPGEAALIGRTKGGLIRNPSQLKNGARVAARQPGTLAAQFACYYNQTAGFYTAAHDAKGYPKDFEMRRTSEGVEMVWNPHCFASDSYTLDFDIVLTTFSADPVSWRHAADIYKSWALTQPWCARSYAQREDIPAWMKAGPAMVRFHRAWLAKPERIEGWLNVYWRKHFPNIPLITAYWGWEKIGSWVTPDYFPVYPSDKAFVDLVAMSRRFGCHAFLWPSGYHWTLTYQKQADGSFLWDDRNVFDAVAAPHAVRDRKGNVYKGDRSWLAGGATSCMCPGDPWTLHWWNKDIALPIVHRETEMIQIDQVVGAAFPFCYSREHGHPPGPGLWMTDAFERHLRSVFEECRKVQPDFVVGFEEPNERFNHLVGIQDYRDTETPNEPASVFNYLYHEFLPTFQSNPHAGDLLQMAHCIVTGQMPHMVPTMVFGPGSPILNNDFEERSGQSFPGWDQVRSYQGVAWNGKFYCDEQEKHGGEASLRLENTADTDIVQVSQNVPVAAGMPGGRKYRLTAWIKTDHLAGRGAINLGAFTTDKNWVSCGSVPASPPDARPVPGPAPGGARVGAGWTHSSADFVLPETAAFLRIMIHISGKAKLWVDDLALYEVLPDGAVVPAKRPETPPGHKLMKQWVELFHGEGRPYLLFGRMIHPPPLESATVTYKNHTVPAVFHDAFRAPDGSEAVVMVNPTAQKQPATLRWKGADLRLELAPEELRLLR